MVLPYSHRVSRVRRYSGYPWAFSVFAYWTLTISGWLSHAILLTFNVPSWVRTPRNRSLLVWPPPRSLATTSGISVDVFSSPYLDVSVQAVPHIRLWIQRMLPEYCSGGFPHSEISGSMLICSSPKLIAACHVLHRLLMPRHSPCALISLTIRSTNIEKSKYWFSSYVELCRLISRYFCLAKIVIFTL